MDASGVLITGEAILEGMYVNSTSSGALDLWHGVAGANIGAAIAGTITPVIGYHYLGDIHTTAGVYAGIANTLDVTFFIRETDI